MLKYHCNQCNIDTELSECPVCKERTELISSSIFWCDECNVPSFDEICPVCENKGRYIGTDVRPVFPDERLLIEILLGCPLKYKDSSVWNTSAGAYFVDGKKISFSVGQTKNANPEIVREKLEQYKAENNVNAFNVTIAKFIEVNKSRFSFITAEATDYIRNIAKDYDLTEMYVSFSGGKDSTVVSDLVLRALSTPEVLHIYGDTTLEFPETKAYVERFKQSHHKTPVLISKNREKNFEELCEQLGPPSRVMRWCCTIFKTGAIQRKMATLFRDKKRILTFYGIRRSESRLRNKYDRESDSPKIAIQKTVSPIIDWLDFDIWLYILTTGIDFNDAYKHGYTRVGCWCCPNNSMWSGFMSQIYMPEEYNRFRNLLLDFAKKIGKPDPEV